jgi:hypothetical protein
MATDIPLKGRRWECEQLDGLVTAVWAGLSRALVLRGESGVQSEMELAFAGLQQVCAAMLDRLDGLPEPQRDALRTAFGLRSGAPPDRFLIGLAVLSLLADVAEEQPLVCLLDDARWLDRASAEALAFVSRRLLAESVALVLAVREPTDELGEVAGTGGTRSRRRRCARPTQLGTPGTIG